MNHSILLLQTNFKQHQQTDLHPSAGFSQQSTGSSGLAVPAPALSVRINGDEDNPSLKKSSHSMGRCHVLWFSFFVLSIDHPSSSISSFLKFVPISHLYLDRSSRADGLSSYLEVGHGKWEPCGNKIIFQWVLLVFPFYRSTCHASFWFTIVIPSQVSSSPIVLLVSSKRSQYHQSYIHSLHLQECLYLSHIPI